MKVLLIAIATGLMLTSCATERIVYVDREVLVPEIVMEQCPPPPIVVPLARTPLDALTETSKNTDVARAYVKTVELCENKLEQYKKALDAVTDESE